LVVQLVCLAQSDLYWKLGINSALDFNSGIPLLNLNDTCHLDLDDASTGICDKNGGLIFYSNGFEVYNKIDRRMLNGFNFNHGTLSDPYFTSGSYPLIKSTIAIPFPNNTNKFYLFYENMEFFDAGSNKLPNKLRYLVVDISLDSGLGDVTYKDSNLIVNDTLEAGNILGIKHGNGSSYWSIIRHYHSNKFYRVLIDSFGVHRLNDQYIGDAYIDSFSFFGIANTSLNGDKIAYVYQSYHASQNLADGQIDIFDFNRCTGFLSNYRKITLPNTIDTTYAISLCFSPNGRFLYLHDQYKLWQIDLYSTNLLGSKILIANRLQGENYLFWQMKNGPDNKIYVANNGSSKSLHVINYPDSFGLACHFVQKQIQLPSGFIYTTGGLPNEPNFSLGKIDCGVGVQEVANTKEGLVIYPNPCGERFLVTGEKLLVNTIEIMDVLGRTKIVRQAHHNGDVLAVDSPLQRGLGGFELNISNLPNGIYFLKATDEKGKIYNSKFVKE
jgi:hypothetical protein